MKEIVALEKLLDKTPGTDEKKRIQDAIDELQKKLLAEEQLKKKPKYVQEQSELKNLMVERLKYEAQLSQIEDDRNKAAQEAIKAK
jgi:hypothetical protein